MMFCWCVFRVIWIQVAGALIHDIHVVFVAYPITWALSGVIFTIYYFKSNWLQPPASVTSYFSGGTAL